MKDALKEVHKKATEIGMVESKPEFTPVHHSEWTGFRDILIPAVEKVLGRGGQPMWACRITSSLFEKFAENADY